MSPAVQRVLEEVDAYVAGTSPVQRAAADLAKRLHALGIDYAIAGAIALGVHGFVRLTTDVDLLVTPDGLARFKAEWLGRGYVEVFPGSKAVRDTVNDVKIDFLLTGQFPGDGKPKSICFPHPRDARASVERAYDAVSLTTLIELKIASGMTAPHRPRDFDDAIRLVRANALPREYAANLHEYVRAKFDELWQLAQHAEEDY